MNLFKGVLATLTLGSKDWEQLHFFIFCYSMKSKEDDISTTFDKWELLEETEGVAEVDDITNRLMESPYIADAQIIRIDDKYIDKFVDNLNSNREARIIELTIPKNLFIVIDGSIAIIVSTESGLEDYLLMNTILVKLLNEILSGSYFDIERLTPSPLDKWEVIQKPKTPMVFPESNSIGYNKDSTIRDVLDDLYYSIRKPINDYFSALENFAELRSLSNQISMYNTEIAEDYLELLGGSVPSRSRRHELENSLEVNIALILSKIGSYEMYSAKINRYLVEINDPFRNESIWPIEEKVISKKLAIPHVGKEELYQLCGHVTGYLRNKASSRSSWEAAAIGALVAAVLTFAFHFVV